MLELVVVASIVIGAIMTLPTPFDEVEEKEVEENGKTD